MTDVDWRMRNAVIEECAQALEPLKNWRAIEEAEHRGVCMAQDAIRKLKTRDLE